MLIYYIVVLILVCIVIYSMMDDMKQLRTMNETLITEIERLKKINSTYKIALKKKAEGIGVNANS